jgi:hypothetical protein
MNKTTAVILLALLVGLLGGFIGGMLAHALAGESSMIEAEQFTLVDDEGLKRAVMRVSSTDKVVVLLYNEQGIVQSGFTLEESEMPELIRNPLDFK